MRRGGATHRPFGDFSWPGGRRRVRNVRRVGLAAARRERESRCDRPDMKQPKPDTATGDVAMPDVAMIHRLIRSRRWDDALAACDAAPSPPDDIEQARRRRMVAALAGRVETALATAERIAADPRATPQDVQHLAQIRLRNLLFAPAFDAAAAALAVDPASQRAQVAALVAAAFDPGLTERATALLGPPSPLSPSPLSPPEPASSTGSGAGETDRPRIVAAPWRLPAYAPYGGAHPVIASALGRGSVLEARWTPADAAPHPGRALSLLPRAAAWAASCRDDAARRALADFLFYRLPLAFYPRPAADFTLHHTVPFGIDGRPWAFHLEQLNMLHAPMLGFPRTVIRGDEAWVRLLGELFAAPACLGIVTHIRRTAALMRRLFPQPEIQAKITHIRLGIDVPPRPPGRPASGFTAAPTAGFTAAPTAGFITAPAAGFITAPAAGFITAPAAHRRRQTLLFTNSLGADNFFVRGGADVLGLATKLSRRRDDVRVLIRAAPPDMPSAAALSRWRRLPNVTWMAERLSEADIEELYRRSDIFLLPSGVLHAVSIVRALRVGMAVAATDVFGVDEFIRHGINGMIVPGRGASVHPPSPGALFSEDCRGLLAPSPLPADGCFHRRFLATVERLLDDPALTARLRRNAARGAARVHDGRRWARELSGWAAAAFDGK
jgi:glycosyltransferase involved in cell wall biosynthesis